MLGPQDDTILATIHGFLARGSLPAVLAEDTAQAALPAFWLVPNPPPDAYEKERKETDGDAKRVNFKHETYSQAPEEISEEHMGAYSRKRFEEEEEEEESRRLAEAKQALNQKEHEMQVAAQTGNVNLRSRIGLAFSRTAGRSEEYPKIQGCEQTRLFRQKWAAAQYETTLQGKVRVTSIAEKWLRRGRYISFRKIW